MCWLVRPRSVMLWLIGTIVARMTVVVRGWGRSKAVLSSRHSASSQSSVYIGRRRCRAPTSAVLLFDIGFGQVSVSYGQATSNAEVVGWAGTGLFTYTATTPATRLADHGCTRLLLESRVHRNGTNKSSFSERYHPDVLKGYRQQGFSTSHYRRTTKHYPRWQDDHIERCHHPRGPQKNWAGACSSHILGQILSGWGWLHHEVC